MSREQLNADNCNMNNIPSIPENVKTKVLNSIRDKKLRFCFVPSPTLKEMVAKDEHPFIKPLSPNIKAAILKCGPGQGVGQLNRYLVEKYVLGTLDERQKFVLDLSDVRVQQNVEVTTQPNIV